MKNNITSPVTDNDFFGRRKELKEAMQLLESNQSLVLSAPRRVGKSSLALKLQKLLDEKGIDNIYIDLEGIETREDFLKTLLEHFDRSALWKSRGVESFHKIISSVKGIGPLKFDFKDENKISDLYYNIAQAIDHDREMVIIIDELTLFLTYREKAGGELNGVKFLLNWLRSLRQVKGTNIRWIFCGSIGLHNFTGIRNLSYTINDLAPVEIGAMNPEEAMGLLDGLLDSTGLQASEEVRKYILERLGWNVPYFIQLLVNRMLSIVGDEQLTKKTVDEAYNSIVRSNILKIWRERLLEYNGFEIMAEYALTELSRKPEGLTKDELWKAYRERVGIDNDFEKEFKFNETLGMLEHDGYLCREGGNRKFCSPLIRDWWNYNYE